MSWTKQALIEQAFAEIGLAAYVYELQPEQLQSALQALDSMVAGWETQGIRLGYALGGELSAESGIPDRANEAVYANLACRIAPRMGKTPSADTRLAAHRGLSDLLIAAAQPQPSQMPSSMPRGAGHKSLERPFMPAPDTSPIREGAGGALDILKD